MFGRLNVIEVLNLRNAPADVANCSEGAVVRLLDVTGHPKIEKWIQFPKALFVFLVVGMTNPAPSTYTTADQGSGFGWTLRMRSSLDIR